MLGRTIGSYQVVSKIGEGDTGVVYLARHLARGWLAAIKVLHPELCVDPERVARLFHEARAATAIRSPGIIEVFDVGALEDHRAYIVMEYLEGESLAMRLRHGRARIVASFALLRGIARALQAAHDHGIVHRDLKPDNIFLVPDADQPGGERVVLLDFGIAALLTNDGQVNHTQTGTMTGTPSYMAPEQCRGTGQVDRRTDLYALGCMAYEMLCGQPPFVAEGAVDVMARHLYLPPASLHSHRPGLAADINELVLRLLRKEPSGRPHSALEVLRAIDRLESLAAMIAHGEDAVYPKDFGEYRLLAPLRQGGMGLQYLAVTRDPRSERVIVIKTLLLHLADAEEATRFRGDASAVVEMAHDNLVPVFDTGLVLGQAFLAMDFVEGRDLRAVWNRCAKNRVAFPIDIVVYIIKELCRGLAYAHTFPALPLVHGDVSPPGILVSYHGEIKLADLGLALSTLNFEKTEPGFIYGKVAYLSTEQARGEKLDGRSDMYSAGVILWELLTGRQLFQPTANYEQDLLSRRGTTEIMRPSQRAPRVPVELDAICLKALAADKQDRYADCGELGRVLQAWLAQHAPTTDRTRMAAFMQQLFADDIPRERAERAELIANARADAVN